MPNYELIHGDSQFVRAVLKDGKFEEALKEYQPGWFYISKIGGEIYSIIQKRKTVEFESH